MTFDDPWDFVDCDDCGADVVSEDAISVPDGGTICGDCWDVRDRGDG